MIRLPYSREPRCVCRALCRLAVFPRARPAGIRDFALLDARPRVHALICLWAMLWPSDRVVFLEYRGRGTKARPRLRGTVCAWHAVHNVALDLDVHGRELSFAIQPCARRAVYAAANAAAKDILLRGSGLCA